MKNRILICSALSLCSTTLFSQKKADTAFLFKKILSDGSYHVVFIDAAKNSSYKKEIQNLHIDSSDYYKQLQDTKNSLGVRIDKHPTSTVSKTWYSLYLYKNKYYVYRPSDPGTSQWVKITDSTMLELYFDPGILVSVLTGTKISKNSVQLNFANSTDGKVSMTVHPIDPARGIAIFERHYGPPETRYTLMVSEDKLHLYSVIVNYNKDSRVEEWEFNTPNYKRLLQGKNR